MAFYGVAIRDCSMASGINAFYSVYPHKASSMRRHKGLKVHRHKAVVNCAAIKN